MAGVGNKLMESKIHPTGRNLQAFGMEDFSSPSQFDTGGGTNSRLMMTRDQIDERRARTQERLTLEDVRFSDMRKKVPLMGRVPLSKMMNSDQEDKSFEKVVNMYEHDEITEYTETLGLCHRGTM